MTHDRSAPPDELDDEGTLLLEQRFSIVPEWVLDADISDAALRLYAVLLRYGQTSGSRMPSRALLARRLRKKSKDTAASIRAPCRVADHATHRQYMHLAACERWIGSGVRGAGLADMGSRLCRCHRTPIVQARTSKPTLPSGEYRPNLECPDAGVSASPDTQGSVSWAR
jgi:hypothetical protein